MANVKELNDAIMLIKSECETHDDCDGCPMFEKQASCYQCSLSALNVPSHWHKINEGDSDG